MLPPCQAGEIGEIGTGDDEASAEEAVPAVREHNLYVKHLEPSFDTLALRSLFGVRSAQPVWGTRIAKRSRPRVWALLCMQLRRCGAHARSELLPGAPFPAAQSYAAEPYKLSDACKQDMLANS